MNLEFTNERPPRGVYMYDISLFENLFMEIENLQSHKVYMRNLKNDFMSDYGLLEQIKDEEEFNKKLDKNNDINQLSYINRRIILKEKLYNMYTDMILTLTSYIFNEGLTFTPTEIKNLNKKFVSPNGYKLDD